MSVNVLYRPPPAPRGEAEALVAKAHQVCPYSNATRNNIDVKLTRRIGLAPPKPSA